MTAAFCSWSGGKDSALALHEAIGLGVRPELLVTMMIEDGSRSRSHGLRRSVLEAQAEAMGLAIRFEAASWDGYERGFTNLIEGARKEGLGTGVFGDIDIEAHREWVEQVCGLAGVSARLPLWQLDRAEVMERVLEAGFAAMIVAVRDGVLPVELLGRVIDEDVLGELAAAGADLAGENGEYHSIVVDGPVFERPLDLTPGERVLRDGVWFLDLDIAPAGSESATI
ncbi:MAG: diphthine--ammonia ligase [Solirubrobacterales bacterium]|nr:diphthine--ammonia ligase [Solirubrobacterales bacterium]